MKSVNLGRMAMALAAMALVAAQAFGAGGDRQVEPQQSNPVAAAQQTAPAAHASDRVILVSLVDHKLALLEDGKVVRVYRVAVGKTSTPSPTGSYTVANRVENPTYYHHGKVIRPGPGNPVGDRWMGLNVHGYGIHGTNAPGSIGKAASHGCIRMGKADIEDLFRRVRVGDKVELVDTRNAETAQIFGDEPVPAAAPALQAAKIEPAPATPSPTFPSGQDVLLNALARTGLTSSASFGLVGAL